MSTHDFSPLAPKELDAAVFYRREFKRVKVVEVIEVTISAGAGTDECPIQDVTMYFDKSGKLLAKGINAPDLFVP